jgi:hypothetical protein
MAKEGAFCLFGHFGIFKNIKKAPPFSDAFFICFKSRPEFVRKSIEMNGSKA